MFFLSPCRFPGRVLFHECEMDQTQIYSYLKNLLPGDIPFLNENDDPPESGTYARMCVETVFPVGCCQQRQHTLDETHQTVCAAYDLERLYSVRLVFCGDEALHYALTVHERRYNGLFI